MTIFFRQPGPKGRTAGVVAPAAVSTTPALPRQASFATSTWGDAFWFARDPSYSSGPGTLYVSSGARVLRDLRGEVGLSPTPAVWTPDVLERLRDRIVALGGPSGPWPIPAAGAVITRGWLAWALWFTYEREASPRNSGAVHLPILLTLPVMGAAFDAGLGGQATGAVGAFDPDELAINPFRAQGPQIDVTGNANGATSSGAGGGFIAALVMALLALAGGDSK